MKADSGIVSAIEMYAIVTESYRLCDFMKLRMKNPAPSIMTSGITMPIIGRETMLSPVRSKKPSTKSVLQTRIICESDGT